jgi:acyl carrier protein
VQAPDPQVFKTKGVFETTTPAGQVGIPMRERILKIVKDNAGLGAGFENIDSSTDLYRAGMTSYASVVLMIALENEFGLEFPDGMLSRSVFESIDAIANAIESLQQVEQ